MSRHAIKISPSTARATRLDLLAALEIACPGGRAEPWRPARVSLVIPADYTLRRVFAEMAIVALLLPLLWATRPGKH